jgi:hypothetical protein
MRRVKLWRPAAVLACIALALAGCGSKHFSDKDLADSVGKAVRVNQPLVCWHQNGRLGGFFNHSYNRVCGFLKTQPSIYVDVTDEGAHTWCSVSPRYKRLPVCPD